MPSPLAVPLAYTTLSFISWPWKRPLWAVPLQQIAYRQLMYLVVIQSVATALAGTRLRWQKLRRLGIVGAPAGVTNRGAPAR